MTGTIMSSTMTCGCAQLVQGVSRRQSEQRSRFSSAAIRDREPEGRESPLGLIHQNGVTCTGWEELAPLYCAVTTLEPTDDPDTTPDCDTEATDGFAVLH
jgi:hypothetical protein